MPIENHIDHEERIVYSICVGTMKVSDFPEYVKAVWGTDDYYGFNELFDTTQADWSSFNFSDLFDVAKNASQLNTIDPDSRFAWVVLEGKQKELTDFYKHVKAMTHGRSRHLEAFYSQQEALHWLTEK